MIFPLRSSWSSWSRQICAVTPAPPARSGGQPIGLPGPAASISIRTPPYLGVAGAAGLAGVVGVVGVAGVVGCAGAAGVVGVVGAVGVVGVVGAVFAGVVGAVGAGAPQPITTETPSNRIIRTTNSFFISPSSSFYI